MTITWLLLAAALVLSAPAAPRPEETTRPTAEEPPRKRGLSPEALPRCCGAAGAALCIGVFGLLPGLPIALVAAPVAAFGARWLQARPRPAPVDSSLALALDLVAVALRAGQSPALALSVAAPAADAATARALHEVGGLLRLGAEPAQAWRSLERDPTLAPVAAAAVRSADSGVRLAKAFEQLAADVRAALRTAAQARAHRVGVLVAAPLGLCFLPSFVCLGIVPLVVGIAGAALAGI